MWELRYGSRDFRKISYSDVNGFKNLKIAMLYTRLCTKDVDQGDVQCFDKGIVQRNVRRYVLQAVVVGYVQIVK